MTHVQDPGGFGWLNQFLTVKALRGGEEGERIGHALHAVGEDVQLQVREGLDRGARARTLRPDLAPQRTPKHGAGQRLPTLHSLLSASLDEGLDEGSQNL